MWPTILAHMYLIIMATMVVMTGNILAQQYGEEIVEFVIGISSQASQERAQLEQGVKDWNKKILE